MRQPLSVLVMVLLAAMPAAAQAPPAAAQAPPAPVAPKIEILEQILVKVNGEIITKTDLEGRQVQALRQRQQQMADAELKAAIAEITPNLLVDAVDELLLLQRGKELGYKVTDEQFKRVIENIRKENKLDSDEAFAAAIKQEGLDMATLRKNLERQMVINQVQQVEVMAKLGVNEEEARTYYNEHKAEFTTPSSITVRELLVIIPGDGKTVNVAADEAAEQKAEGALARVKGGEAFDKLVTEISDAPSKANGGLVGPLQLDELAADIRKLLAPLKAGQVTSVFRTANGYGVLKLETATAPEVKTFEASRDQIADKVFGAKRGAEYDKYIKKLRAQAIIEWKNEEMHKLWAAKTGPETKSPGGH